MIRVMVAYAVYFVEGRLRGFDGRGLAHQTLGSVIVALEEGECSAGIDSLGGVAGATKVAFGGGVVASLQGSIGGVDVGYLEVDKLDYLAKGGRCSSVVALGANLLKLKPCIVLADGKMTVGKKYRGAFDKVLPDYVRDQLAGKDVRTDRIIIVHTRCNPAIPAAVEQVVREYGFREVIHTVAGSTISCHCGPNTLGILFLRA